MTKSAAACTAAFAGGLDRRTGGRAWGSMVGGGALGVGAADCGRRCFPGGCRARLFFLSRRERWAKHDLGRGWL